MLVDLLDTSDLLGLLDLPVSPDLQALLVVDMTYLDMMSTELTSLP